MVIGFYSLRVFRLVTDPKGSVLKIAYKSSKSLGLGKAFKKNE